MSSPELLSDFGTAAVDRAPPRSRLARVLVWDLPLRMFHWSLVLAVTVAIVTAELGGAWMDWHGRAGLAVVGLLVFRAVWGVVGSATARFANFAPSASRLRRYLRGEWRGVGHNPLGALSVFAMLGLLALQAGTGLFGNDDIAFTGPLNHLVDDTLGARLTGWHRVLANGLFVLLGLHVAAVAFHEIVKRHALLKPMLTGWREDTASGSFAAGSRHALIAALTIAAVAVVAIAWLGR